MKLTFLGHAAFHLEAAGTSVLVDPFLTGNSLASTKPDDFSPGTILLTHAHNDHVGDTVAIAKRAGSTVVAIVELAKWLGTQGIGKTVGANLGGTVAFTGGTAKFVPAWHTAGGPDGPSLGVAAGLVVRFGGATVWFAGDTCLFSDMKLIGEEGLDVAVLPIGDHFTMGPEDAARAAEFCGAKTIVPCHYDTFPPIRQDPERFKALVAARTDARVVVLAPGEAHET